MATDKINDRISASASIGASASQTKPLTLGGVFDLTKQSHREAYQELMATNPLALEKNKERILAKWGAIGVGFSYAADRRAAELQANLTVGDKNLLSFYRSSSRTTDELRVNTATGSNRTKGSQQSFDRSLSGIIPENILGQTGSVSVRATKITDTTTGKETFGATMSKSIDVRAVDAGMVSRVRRMLTDLGVDTSSTPATDATGGKGHLDIEFAMTESFFDKLDALGKGDAKVQALREVFDRNYADINGAPPPWGSQYQQTFEETLARRWPPHLSAGPYNAATGRDWVADLASYTFREELAKELTKTSRDPKTWKAPIEIVGRASNRDFLVAGLGANELGAPLVSFNLTANGVALSAEPNAEASPQSLEDRMGWLTSRWALNAP